MLRACQSRALKWVFIEKDIPDGHEDFLISHCVDTINW